MHVAVVHIYKGSYNGRRLLNGKVVPGISTRLDDDELHSVKPVSIVGNQGKGFIGSIVLGMGFILSPEVALSLIEKDPKYRDVIFPYLVGEDLGVKARSNA